MKSIILLCLFSIFNHSSSAVVGDEPASLIETESPQASIASTYPSCSPESLLGCSGVFVNSYKLRLVFDWWSCDKAWQYALTLIGLFGFAMASPCIKAYREILRSKAVRSYVFDCLLTHFILFLFALFAYTLDFLLMLIVMSFNVGVFLSVVSGYALGYVLSSIAYSSYKDNNRQSFSRVNEECC